jgi:sugar phosphate isomerase/epimerase
VKLAVSSTPFAGLLQAGHLTHLEWLEACASRLGADGVSFGLTDFPRRDPEYAAQVRKVAVDLGLVPVALEAPGLLDPAAGDDVRAEALALACGAGVLILRTTTGPVGDLPPRQFVLTVATAKAFAKQAKEANLTVAVAAQPHTVAAGLAELQHLVHDTDSAWLRYELPAEASREAIGPRDRVLIEQVALSVELASIDAGRRGWYILEGEGGADPFARVAAAAAELRRRPQMPSTYPA